MKLNRSDNHPNFASTMVTFLLCMVVTITVVDAGIPAEARHTCKVFDHERLLQVPGCEDLKIPDRMCRGLCPSYVLPKLKNSQQRDRADNIEITKNFESTTAPVDSAATGSDDKDSDDDGMIVLEQSNKHNQCRMCLPIRHKYEKFQVKCRREQPAYRHFGASSSSGDAVHELREVKVKILQECQCKQVKCEPWTNPSISKTEDDDDDDDSDFEDDIDGTN